MSLRCKLESCTQTKAITDEESGEIVCSNCGLVVKEKIDSQVEPHNELEFYTQTRVGPQTSLRMHDKGMNTMMSNKDHSGRPLTSQNKSTFHRLRIWDSRSKIGKSSQKTLRNALLFLNSIEEKLGLPQVTIENTAYLFRKAIDKKLTRGRNSTSLMGAALYVSCRQTSTPRNIADIARVGNLTKRALQRSVRNLIKELDLDIPQYNISSFVTRLANDLGIDEKTKRYAIRILDDIKKKGITEGKNPVGQAAASLYVASIVNGYSISQHKISKISNISTVTLRNRINTIRKTLAL